jgi:excisionase family DNA binding protein
MTNSLILENVSKSELKDLISRAVAEELSKSRRETLPAKEFAILTRRQTCEMLGITLSTLHEWTKSGVIQGTRIGTRVRYRQADVEAALKDIQHVKYSRR